MSKSQTIQDSRVKGFLSLFGAAFIYGTFGVLIRFISPMFGDNFQVVVRFFLAFLFILSFLIVRRKSISLPKTVLLKTIILGVVFVFVVILFTYSVLNTKLVNTVFLLYAGSITSSFLIGTFLFKENVTKNKLFAILIAFIGVAMYGNALFGLSLGIVTGLGSGLCDGIQNSIRRTLKGFDRNLVLLYSFASGSLVALIISLISGEQMIKSVSILPIIVTIIYALLLLTLGNFLLYGFQHFDVNIGTVILSMELVFALIFGLIIYKEIPSAKELIGGFLIFTASILSSIDMKSLHAKFKSKI